MADTNGQPNPRVDALDASQVKLMTDYGVFVTEQERAWQRHQAFVAEQEDLWRRYAIQRQEGRERAIALDRRIGDRISAIGQMIPREP